LLYIIYDGVVREGTTQHNNNGELNWIEIVFDNVAIAIAIGMVCCMVWYVVCGMFWGAMN